MKSKSIQHGDETFLQPCLLLRSGADRDEFIQGHVYLFCLGNTREPLKNKGTVFARVSILECMLDEEINETMRKKSGSQCAGGFYGIEDSLE